MTTPTGEQTQNHGFSLEPTIWFFAGQTSAAGPVRRIQVVSFPMKIGRREDLGLTLPCSSVSKEHAEVFEQDGTLWVRDLGSTNGTFVNGTRVEGAAEIKQGDILQFATMVFRVGRDSEASANQSKTVSDNSHDQALSLMHFDQLIDGDAVIPFYQPIVSVTDTRNIVAYEVLGRSRLIGLQTPSEMFSTAARLNLETELSRVFCRRGVEVARQFPSEVCLYVNTHPRELEDGSLPSSLVDLRNTNPDQHIVVEIHERGVTNPSMLKVLRDHLTDLDMGLAFDDFGAGETRLVELSEVQPDCLKFDMKLVQNIYDAPASRQQVVASLIKMVNDLGIQSLVEGVERAEDHATLLNMGAQLGQGFYYGRPASIRDYLAGADE